ncbi:putative nuclease HARBI1 isoform X2 [Sitophilus oryzae]|uniref:Nuclease HARBI1 isoform X2 n=1 Tax=Sitophilus oryzae TaxID=7048 RepID=A0A6J2YH92_SITOR|nr:putative nuclease HARBI1 isoform X2 [Sitophilus oryzae]XP_030762255.1 putative nuclease HARBI1 isoform X2 [Sitophilus oryzae]
MDDLMNVLAIRNLENAELQYRRNVLRNPGNAFIELSERQFIKIFRLSKDLCRFLIQLLEPYMRPQRRETDLDVQSRILAALKFYGSGCYQPDVALNKYIDMCQASVSHSIDEVTNALNHPEIFDQWVEFPNNFEKLNRIREQFFRIHRFPGVIGCVDCTHVAIVPPNIEDPEYPEHIYVNRKHYHSINVQLICDANLKILHVNAKYPGSTNDAYIWSRSNVLPFLRDLHAAGHTDYFLLGDSGYPLRTWLLIPFQNVEPNTIESSYNERHKHTRVKIECCNGVLKARFRCLLKHRVLHYKPRKACEIINACVVLHNICIEYNVPLPPEDPDEGKGIEVDFGIINDIIEDQDLHVARSINPELADGQRARITVARSFQRPNQL